MKAKRAISHLPNSWVEVRLGDFVESEKGKKPQSESKNATSTHHLPYVDIQAFEEGVINSWTDGTNCRLCCESDFLMVWDGSRSGLVGRGLNGALGSTLVRINFPSMANLYAFYFLQSKYQELNTRAKGSGTPHVDPDLLWNYDFPIPPINEQYRIVAKIDELFSELDKGVESLKTAREQLKVYRPAVLKHAFEGKLTARWREDNKNKLESSDQLLARVKQEREVRYQQRLEEWKAADKAWEAEGKEGKKPRKPPGPVLQIDFQEFALGELADLPDGWVWATWEYILASEEGAFKRGPFGSALKKAFFVEDGIKVYEQYCPINDDCSFERYFITEEKFEELKAFEVRDGDFLISCSGVTLGRITQVPEGSRKGIINQALLRVRLDRKLYSDEFFKLFFRSSFFQKRIFESSTGTAIPNVKGVTDLKALPVPLLSTDEQNEIVLRLSEITSELDAMEQEISSQLNKTDALRQSILKTAFAGKLVSQDPTDEPASVLLERIRAEKAEQGKDKKNKKRKDAA